MKGWRASAWHKLETGSGYSERAYFLPDVGSIGLSFSARSRSLGSRPGDLGTRGSFFRAHQAPRPASRADKRLRIPQDAMCDLKKQRQPFTCSIDRRTPK
jgi:hypothetical protein